MSDLLTPKALSSRPATEEERGAWVRIGKLMRERPQILPYIEKKEPKLYRSVVEGLRSLAIEARSDEWRDPEEGVGGRPEQLIPGTQGSFSDRTDWVTWLLTGGRGSGKSRTGAEATRELILGRQWKERPKWALVGQTLESVRQDMVENTLLEVLPPGSVRKWNRGPCELWLTNGAYLKGYSSEAPRKLRGGNFHGAWFDELATWADAKRSPLAVDTTYSNAMGAVRLHDHKTWVPRVIATTTPKSVALIRNPFPDDPENPGPGLYDNPKTVISNMSTLVNEDNLSQHYIDTYIKGLLGTRLYDQEVLGLLVDAAIGAQWTHELVQKMKYSLGYPEGQAGGLMRIVVAVDPSVAAGRGDECGIVVSGLARDGRVYVLEDASVRAPAARWCQVVKQMFVKWGAVAVVAEENQGGELVEETLGRYAPNLPMVSVWAKQGKMLRAEPVALLSDQDRVRFAGDGFSTLQTQMMTWEGKKGDSPDRLDAFVYSVAYLLPVDTGLEDLVRVRRGSGSRG